MAINCRPQIRISFHSEPRFQVICWIMFTEFAMLLIFQVEFNQAVHLRNLKLTKWPKVYRNSFECKGNNIESSQFSYASFNMHSLYLADALYLRSPLKLKPPWLLWSTMAVSQLFTVFQEWKCKSLLNSARPDRTGWVVIPKRKTNLIPKLNQLANYHEFWNLIG